MDEFTTPLACKTQMVLKLEEHFIILVTIRSKCREQRRLDGKYINIKIDLLRLGISIRISIK